MKRHLIFYAVIVSLMATLPACAGPLTYSAEAIEAKVIDADTKRPLEGVIVVAHWQLEHGTVGGNVPTGQLRVMETVTDKDGKFSFSGFGPETVWNSFLVNEDPRLLLFKSGYRYESLANEYNSSRELRTHPIRRSVWSGRTIALKKFKGSGEEWARHLSFLKTSLGFAYNGNNCEWKQIPHMLVAQHKEMLRLNEKQIFNTLQPVERVSGQKKCGSAQEFFRSYLQ